MPAHSVTLHGISPEKLDETLSYVESKLDHNDAVGIVFLRTLLKQQAKPKGPFLGPIFEKWWLAYPRRVAKQKTYEAWCKAGKGLVAEGMTKEQAAYALQEAAEAFAASPKAKGDYCPYPATWLNQGRWDDDRAAWQDAGGDRKRGGKGINLDQVDLT